MLLHNCYKPIVFNPPCENGPVMSSVKQISLRSNNTLCTLCLILIIKAKQGDKRDRYEYVAQKHCNYIMG